MCRPGVFAFPGQLDNPGLSLAEAGKEILAAHELSAGKMEPLTGGRLDDLLETTEQASAISQPQAWHGIDCLLNLEPRFEGNRITLSTACRSCRKTLDFRGFIPPYMRRRIQIIYVIWLSAILTTVFACVILYLQ